jgi:uncharacterized protein
MRISRRYQIILGLLLTMGSACLPISAWIDEFRSTAHLVAYEAIWWALVALTLAYVTFVERLPLSSIGFRRPGASGIAIGVAAGVLILVGMGGIIYVAFPALGLHDDPVMNTLIATPFWWRLISVTRAAVGEEVLFRGYAIERLQELTGSRVVAAVVSCTIFTLAHLGT